MAWMPAYIAIPNLLSMISMVQVKEILPQALFIPVCDFFKNIVMLAYDVIVLSG
jgi:hypothetical protein